MKARTYSQLKKEFDLKVKKLQNNCQHKRTKVMEHWWAPGHPWGFVKVCLTCNKILKWMEKIE